MLTWNSQQQTWPTFHLITAFVICRLTKYGRYFWHRCVSKWIVNNVDLLSCFGAVLHYNMSRYLWNLRFKFSLKASWWRVCMWIYVNTLIYKPNECSVVPDQTDVILCFSFRYIVIGPTLNDCECVFKNPQCHVSIDGYRRCAIQFSHRPLLLTCPFKLNTSSYASLDNTIYDISCYQ